MTVRLVQVNLEVGLGGVGRLVDDICQTFCRYARRA
jgi:hypothetical protein